MCVVGWGGVVEIAHLVSRLVDLSVADVGCRHDGEGRVGSGEDGIREIERADFGEIKLEWECVHAMEF
jgi:hypothetical protein